MTTSISEEHGLKYMTDTDLAVYSVGISTAGVAEIKMAKSNTKRKIIATTLDGEGLNETKDFTAQEGLQDRLICKIEDVSKKLPYDKGYFDYVYARLVLHYLSKQELNNSLLELNRILKKSGKIFIVVRSTDCPDCKHEGSSYDEETGFTHYFSPNSGDPRKRYFHTEESISSFLKNAGFEVVSIESYTELLYSGYHRRRPSKNLDYLIEVKAKKVAS